MVVKAIEDINVAGNYPMRMPVASTTAVNFSEMKTSFSATETLVAFSIGSGMGISIYDPVSAVGGILNFILPESTNLNPAKSEKYPFMFADTGIPAFLMALIDLGAQSAHMKVVIAGGAHVLDQTGAFNIGHQNYQAAKSIMDANRLSIHYKDIGGIHPRTLRLEMSSGKSFINLPDQGEIKI